MRRFISQSTIRVNIAYPWFPSESLIQIDAKNLVSKTDFTQTFGIPFGVVVPENRFCRRFECARPWADSARFPSILFPVLLFSGRFRFVLSLLLVVTPDI